MSSFKYPSVTVRIKLLDEFAKIPQAMRSGDAGVDLYAVSRKVVRKGGRYVFTYGTGIALEIPEGYVGLLAPRSSISKTKLRLANSIGIIDSNYRGELILKFVGDTSLVPVSKNGPYVGQNGQNEPNMERGFSRGDIYSIGDRIGQLMIIPYPIISFEAVESLSETSRGEGGFGSSGR